MIKSFTEFFREKYLTSFKDRCGVITEAKYTVNATSDNIEKSKQDVENGAFRVVDDTDAVGKIPALLLRWKAETDNSIKDEIRNQVCAYMRKLALPNFYKLQQEFSWGWSQSSPATPDILSDDLVLNIFYDENRLGAITDWSKNDPYENTSSYDDRMREDYGEYEIEKRAISRHENNGEAAEAYKNLVDTWIEGSNGNEKKLTFDSFKTYFYGRAKQMARLNWTTSSKTNRQEGMQDSLDRSVSGDRGEWADKETNVGDYVSNDDAGIGDSSIGMPPDVRMMKDEKLAKIQANLTQMEAVFIDKLKSEPAADAKLYKKIWDIVKPDILSGKINLGADTKLADKQQYFGDMVKKLKNPGIRTWGDARDAWNKVRNILMAAYSTRR